MLNTCISPLKLCLLKYSLYKKKGYYKGDIENTVLDALKRVFFKFRIYIVSYWTSIRLIVRLIVKVLIIIFTQCCSHDKRVFYRTCYKVYRG
ncbi:MAG: hypothetical protein ACTSPH_07915 [Promethearchaeota archaeon]